MDLDRLTAEMGWVRRLAGAIVRDDATADDVAQDAWIVASAESPDDRPLRPWLSRIVNNVVRSRRRGEARRQVRELASEVPSVATPADLAERVATQRAVADEVLALGEPYRAVVLLFYVDGLPTRDIAARLGVPDGTVRRRLKIARDLLKQRLSERRDAPRGGWLLALAVLAKTREASAAASLMGGLAMKKIIVALVLVVLLVGGAVWWRHRARGSDRLAVATAPIAGAHVGTTTSTAPSWLAQTGVTSKRVAGHVRSAHEPVAKAIVRLALAGRDPVLATTDGDGAFDLGLQPAATVEVSAEASGFAAASIEVAIANPNVHTDALVLELGACHTRIFGSVFDASGGGIAKARLSSAGLAGTDADTNGAYSLCLSDNANVRVEADGYGTITVAFAFRGEIRHDFLLTPEGGLVGHVVTEDDRPVAGALVSVDPDRSEVLHDPAGTTTLADAEGRFRIAGLVPGRYWVDARSEGKASRSVLATATMGATSREVRVVVASLARLSGRVVMNHAPVAGARVVCNSDSAYSQLDGSFVLADVNLGTTSCQALPYQLVAPESIKVDRASVDGVTLEVTSAPVVRGRVTRGGRAVANAVVSCHNNMHMTRDGSQVVNDVMSDATGSYVMPVPSAAPPAHQAIKCDLDAVSESAASHRVELLVDHDVVVDLDLDAGASLHAAVVDERGAPVGNVFVVASGPVAARAMTDAHGEVALSSLRGGADYTLSVFPTPAAQAAFEPVGDRPVVHVDAGDSAVTGVRIPIHYTSLAIHGVVVDETGAAVPDVSIKALVRQVWSGALGETGTPPNPFAVPQTISAANGEFSISKLAAGSYTLIAHGAGGSEALVADVAAGTTTRIELARGGAIEGDAVGYTGRVGVAARNVTNPAVATMLPAQVEGTHFTLSGLAPGRYTVEGVASSGVEQDGAAVDVIANQTAHVTLTARAHGRITGHVIDFVTKKPVRDLSCANVMAMGGMRGSVTGSTWSDQPTYPNPGEFTMGSMIGRIRVICSAIGYADAGVDVDVVASEPSQVTLAAVKIISPPSDPGFDLLVTVLPLTVVSVENASAAQHAGLAVGDHLVSIDGVSVSGLLTEGALRLVENHRPGTTVVLGIERSGASRLIKFAL
ncbi:MAG: sigma-70 family RNA polymerase sigma factor [Deltaproteobacteria bacterium]